jgi:hypothetical protein
MDVQNKKVKEGDKWFVYSKDGKKKLGGPYDTEGEADERMKQVEHFKNIKNQFVSVLFNAKPKLVRNDKMADKDYVVVPMVMLVEGVHAGSEGPYLYPKEENVKRVELWNMKPVVVYHPDTPSACTPEVLNTRQIGIILNAKADEDGKVNAEAWLDEARVKKVDKRIWDAIQNEETLELSTGLMADSDEEAGEWNGEKYNGTLHNYGPDHLAVLPDQVGACSVEDGAGFYRNEKGELVRNGGAGSGNFGHFGRPGEVGGSGGGGGSSGGALKVSDAKIGDKVVWDTKERGWQPGSDKPSSSRKTGTVVDKEDDGRLVVERPNGKITIVSDDDTLISIVGSGLKKNFSEILNEFSVNTLRDDLQKLIAIKGQYRWIEDIYPDENYFVYSADGGGGFYKQGYTQDGDTVKLDGVPENVTRVISYKTVKNETKPVQNTVKGSPDMDKKKIVDGLIANKKFEEKDRTVLMAMPDDMVERLEKSYQNAEPALKVEDKPVVQNAEPKAKPITMEDLPEDLRRVVQNGQRIEKEQKDKFIGIILKHPKNTFTKEYLATKDVEELQNLANLAVTSDEQEKDVQNVMRFNYQGMADPIQNDDCLDVPTLEPPTYQNKDKVKVA